MRFTKLRDLLPGINDDDLEYRMDNFMQLFEMKPDPTPAPTARRQTSNSRNSIADESLRKRVDSFCNPDGSINLEAAEKTKKLMEEVVEKGKLKQILPYAKLFRTYGL